MCAAGVNLARVSHHSSADLSNWIRAPSRRQRRLLRLASSRSRHRELVASSRNHTSSSSISSARVDDTRHKAFCLVSSASSHMQLYGQ